MSRATKLTAILGENSSEDAILSISKGKWEDAKAELAKGGILNFNVEEDGGNVKVLFQSSEKKIKAEELLKAAGIGSSAEVDNPSPAAI